jgi:isocitrate dehydrogenase
MNFAGGRKGPVLCVCPPLMCPLMLCRRVLCQPAKEVTWKTQSSGRRSTKLPPWPPTSLLPIVQAFTRGTGVEVETADISLAGRIIANFPDNLTDDQKIPTSWRELGELCQTPEANIIKLPNISASIPQLQDAIKELQGQGYDIPTIPRSPERRGARTAGKRFAVVLGSAVNPVLREGNSDRRAAASVKKFAQKHPHKMMKPWPESGSKTRVAHMTEQDFYGSEKSHAAKPRHGGASSSWATRASTTVLKDGLALLEGEVIDTSR